MECLVLVYSLILGAGPSTTMHHALFKISKSRYISGAPSPYSHVKTLTVSWGTRTSTYIVANTMYRVSYLILPNTLLLRYPNSISRNEAGFESYKYRERWTVIVTHSLFRHCCLKYVLLVIDFIFVCMT